MVDQLARATSRSPHPQQAPLHVLFTRQAAATPDATALVFGARELTYEALDERANKLARHLQALGVGGESRVGIFLERGPDLVVALLAVLKAGGAYVPIDPEYPPARVAYMVEHAAAPVVLSQQSLAGRLAAGAAQVVVLDEDRVEIERRPGGPLGDGDVDPDALAYVIYTSGSTGSPNGVMVGHGALANFMTSMARRPGLESASILVAVTTVSFDIAALELFLPLLVGARVVLASSEEARDPDALVELVGRCDANVLQATPTHWRMLLGTGWRPGRGFVVLCGGEKLPADLAVALVSEGATVWDLYGPTETTIWSAVGRLGPDGGVVEWEPVAHTPIRVLDESLEVVPTGATGELFIGGPGLARGYADRPGLTANRFVPDPHAAEPGARMYRTGDVARRREDGAVEILGRVDHQVKVRGFRVELGEIELALRRHDSVAEAAVVASEDVDGHKRLVAYVVPSAAPDAGMHDDERLTEWQTVWDDTYGDGVAEDPALDTRGWTSSSTGRRVPREEMEEWVSTTASRCLDAAPRTVLEIGCGTGLLTRRIAPHVDRYVGIDFSKTAIDSLREELTREAVDDVELHQRRADELHDLGEGAFDLVVINSVVQYFPGEDYLLRVLERALEVVAPGGRVFVGDVRNLGLFDAFHTWTAAERAAPDVRAEQVVADAAATGASDNELLVDPSYFTSLPRRLPRVRGVRVLPKAGRFPNEMTRFRYDVWLDTGSAERLRVEGWLDWPEDGLQGVEQILAQRHPDLLGVTGVPHVHAWEAVTALALLDADPSGSVGDVRERLTTARRGVPSLQALEDCAARAGYDLELSAARSAGDGTLDGVFVRRGVTLDGLSPEFPEPVSSSPLVHEPRRRSAHRLDAALVRDLRAHIEQELPAYMIPSGFVELARLPQTPNGKLDRNALPAPPAPTGAPAEGEGAPLGEVEEGLAGIWEDVLRVSLSSRRDDFFELGGDSLLAARVLARVRSRFGVRVSLRRMFEARTLERLAAEIAAASESELDPIEPADRSVPLPLSFAQQRLWFLEQLNSGSPELLIPYALDLRGPLDDRVLSSALDGLVARHEVMRTRYTNDRGAPLQVVEPPGPVPFGVADLTGSSPSEQERVLAESVTDELNTPFDLEKAPLLRGRLLRFAPERHVLLLTTHHIAADGWSLGIMAEELQSIYGALSGDVASPLPPLPLQYADCAMWQLRSLDSEVLERDLAYWRERLSDLPQLELPTDRPRPPMRSGRGATVRFVVAEETVDALRELAVGSGASLFMTLLAAFKVLMARYSGQDDVAVGTPTAGRPRVELERLVGLFVNTIVLRSDLTGNPRFTDLLGRVRDASLADLAHQELPFERLVDELQPERGLAQTPLFQVMFALQNVDQGTFALRELDVIELPLDSRTAKFDLTLELAEHPGGELGGMLEYATDLFDHETVERLVEHFKTLLASIAAAPQQRVRELDLLTEPERRLLLGDWNDTARALPDQLLHELLEEQARRTPEASAVRCGAARLRYSELDERANALAHELRARGVGAETTVGICMERTPDVMVAILGVLKAGGAYVPLDPAMPPDRLAFVLEDTQAPIVLVQERSRRHVPAGSHELLSLDEEAAALAARPRHAPARVAGPDNSAYVIYTSGSTGRPKGVVVTNRGLLNYLLWSVEAYEPGLGSGSPAHSSIGFDLTVTAIFPALLVGRTVELVHDPEPGALSRVLQVGGFSLVKITPSHLDLIAQLLPPEQAKDATRRLVAGGEQLLGDALAFWARHAPETLIVNEYGPTETVVGCCYHEERAGDIGPGQLPIGRPISNTLLYVLGPGQELLPVGVPGELYIGGACVARGYLNCPDLTAASFLPDPFASRPGERMYRTGDLVRRRADGNLEHLGRRDDQVKIRGFRIELGEVEAHLASHPRVEDVAVAALEVNEGDKRLVAYVVAPGEGATPAELRSFLAERLPAELMPSYFVSLDALPLTSNGKLDRRALPAPNARQEVEERVLPRNPAEEAIAAIYAEVLELDEVGVHDGFFDLGGNSLRAMLVVARLRRQFAVEISVPTVFQAQTVADLAQTIAARMAASFHATFGTGPGEQAPEPDGIDTTTARSPGEDPPIVPVDRSEPLPLSFAQQRLWFLDQLGEGSPTQFLMPFAMELRGPLDEQALERAVSEVVSRHEVLRTRFVSVDGRPMQVVEPPKPMTLRLLDLSHLSVAERDARLATLGSQEVQTPFALDSAPLLRARLVRLEPLRHVLFLTMHHVVSDGWSLRILDQELGELYDAFRTGREPALARLELQYGDYAVWQRRRLAGDALDGQLASWREKLEGISPLDLPTDRQRPATRSGRGAMCRFELPREEVEPLRALGREHGATLFMTLLAGFQALLGRYAGQVDVAVGTPSAGRSRVELESAIGFFVNTLVLRGDLSGDPSFGELLERVRATALHAFSHDEVPFERLVEELQPERDLSRTPLFQVMFALGSADETRFSLGGLEVEELPLGWDTSKFDLTLDLVEEDDGALSGTFEYSTDLFDHSTIERMARHYRRFLERAVAAPADPLGQLDFLSAVERRQLTETWNDTSVPVSQLLLHELVEEQAERTPDASAVIGRGIEVSYRELNRRANRLAHELRARGVGPDVPVGVCLEPGPEMVVALLAVAKAGGAYVPLDPEHPRDRLAFVLADTATPLVLVEATTRDRIPRDGHAVLSLDEEHDRLKTLPADDLPATADRDGAAYVVYTSGSTGRPKGVVVTNGGIRNRVLWAVRHLGMGVDDRVLQKTALTFDAAGWEFFAPLVSGGTVALAGRDAHGDPAAIVAAAAETGSTILQLVPSMLQLVVDEPGLVSCSALRLVCSAGERLTPELCERLRNRLPVDVVNTYGPTEASIDATAWRYCAGHPAGVPIGSPLDNVRILLLDSDGGLVPVGVAGEIHIGGDGVARGYLGRPGLTAERFVPDPYGAEPGRRLYRTGDLARWGTDGNLEFIGRLDHQVKVRGVRVEPGEIEVALAEHEGVARAAVTVRSGAAGLPQLVAYVVPRADEVDPDVLRSHLLRSVPGPLVPDLFVSLDRFPLTSSGKIDRALLPDPQMPDETGHVAPRTPTEISIAAIWREVLRVDRIGVDDSFFLLGGHSLLATQMLSRVRAAFDVDVSLRDVFVAHTVARLAEVVARALPETALPPLVRAPRDRALPLSFGQERLWFLDRLEPGSSEYLVPVAVRIRGRLDADALEQALCELVARHEILRTRYANVGGEPVQVVDEPSPLPLGRVDLTSVGGAEPDAAIEALFASEKSKPFDLATGPVLRATLARLGEDDHLLLVVAHHIAFDGWSTSVVAQELDRLYSAFSAGLSPDLPPPALQYGDVAVWQRGHLTGELRDAQLDYWRTQLDGLEVLDLPTDRPRPQVRDAEGATVPVRIPPSVGKRVLEVGRASGATPFMTFLAAFALVLSRYGDTEDVAVGTPIAGRTRPELESMVGFFVNTLVLRLRIGGAETFADLLERARETALDAYAHQDLPFERLVDDLQPRRDLSRNPIFQVMLVLQNTERGVFRLDGAQVEEVDVDWGTAKFDLTLQLEELADGSTTGELEYATALFDAETAERLARRYEHTLATVLADPAAPLEQLELLPPEERSLLLYDSPVADVAEPEGALHDVIDERAAATPGVVAVAGGGIEMTYDELRRRSNALARELLAKGVTAEQPVAICLDRSPEAVVALLATLKAGGVYVPFDPGHPSRRLALMLDDVGARVAISTRAGAARLEELGLVCVSVDDPETTAYGTDDLGRETDPEQLAYVIYTSGSTGSPKGVMVSHRSYAHHCAVIAREYGIEADDRVVLLSALTFDVAMDQIGATLAVGATVVVADPRFWSPAELPDKLAAHGVTVIEITPAYYRAMLDTIEPDDERLRGVKLMNVGSDVVTLDDVQRWHRTGLPGRFLCNYGPTEATVTCLLYPPSRQDLELRPEATAPVGRPVPGTNAYVVDADLRLVPRGARGELCLGGARLARGYRSRPDLTAERFVPDPFSGTPGARLYRTGDLVRIRTDGNVEFLGRLDGQVKLRGFRIELGEIEAVLTEHGDVSAAAVVARDFGVDDRRLVAYLVPANGRIPGVAELREFLRERLPDYMVPSVWVPLEGLPLTPSRKVDRKALPVPDDPGSSSAGEYRAPRTAAEETIASIWSGVLGAKQVGVDDDFFELGGHSLLATRVLARLHDTFEVDLPLRLLFEATTVADLASAVEASIAAELDQLSDAEVEALLARDER